MVLPRWIPFLVAAWVIAFGIMRLRIATRKDDEDEAKPNYRKGGYYARSKKSHGVFGVAYLVLGGYCIAMGFGYQFDFMRGCAGGNKSTTTETTPGTAPLNNAVPVTRPEPGPGAGLVPAQSTDPKKQPAPKPPLEAEVLRPPAP